MKTKRHRKEYTVQGMDCADCALKVEKSVRKVKGIEAVTIDFISGKMNVHFAEEDGSDEAVRRAVKGSGYKLESADSPEHDTQVSFLQRNRVLLELLVSALFIGAAASARFSGAADIWFFSLLLPGVGLGAYRIARKALSEVRSFSLGINALMILAVTGAIIIGEWVEGAVVILLFAVAEWLESYSIGRARRSIESLFDIVPETANVVRNGSEQSVPVRSIAEGQRIRIKPGNRIPLDGIVRDGTSRVDQSPITGESVPVVKHVGDQLFSGTINLDGFLEMEVTGSYENTTLARIIHLVEEARSRKTKAEQFIDRFSRYYTPVVVAVSILVALLLPVVSAVTPLEAVYRALVLLVIACPCALVISTPVAVTSALNRAASAGILLKGGSFLEGFGKLKAIAFDKTGTITYGKPRVSDIIVLDGYSKEDIIGIAASLESYAEHPLARPILDYAGQNGIELQPVKRFRMSAGKGVEGEIDGQLFRAGNRDMFSETDSEERLRNVTGQWNREEHTAVFVGNGTTVMGVLLLADSIRPESKAVSEELRKGGIGHLIMLSGDRPEIASRIAERSGMDRSEGGLLPEQKLDVIIELEREYEHIAMVGDGINDAPALAGASIGVAMGASGSDLALETADVVLMSDELEKLPFLRRLSRKTVQVIKENIAISLGLKFLFFALAIPGLATLWMAVFADMGASLIVIFNGLKLMKYR